MKLYRFDQNNTSDYFSIQRHQATTLKGWKLNNLALFQRFIEIHLHYLTLTNEFHLEKNCRPLGTRCISDAMIFRAVSRLPTIPSLFSSHPRPPQLCIYLISPITR